MNASRIAFHSNSVRHLLLGDDLRLARLAGYNGIVCSFRKMEHFLERNNQKELKKIVKDSGMAIFGISNIRVDLANTDEETVRIVKRYSRLVRAMKGNFVSITPDKLSPGGSVTDKFVKDYVANLGAIADGASEYGVNVAIELENPDPLLSSPIKITYMIDKSGKDNLGFVFDTFSFWRARISYEEVETIERSFYAVYIADAPDKKKLKETDRLIPGEGILDFERFLRIIKNCNYKGPFAIKLHSDYKTKGRNKELLRNARNHLKIFLSIIDYL